MSIGLVGTSKKERFQVPGCPKPLGALTLADVLEYDDEAKPVYRSFLRHEEMSVHWVYGPSCIRQCWTFGALSCAYSRVLYDSMFKWDMQANRLVTDPSRVLINWVGTSDSLAPISGFD